jgi:GNAT superfamily N-acetyltransferase
MEIIKTKNLTEHQFNQINSLWNQEYPARLKDRFAILFEGACDYDHYIIEDNSGNVLAWAANFEKDNEVRFSIIVDNKQQGRGLGTLLVNRLKEELNDIYGWVVDRDDDKKVDGQNYRSPLLFYVKNGFEILSDQRIDNELLNAVKIKRAGGLKKPNR